MALPENDKAVGWSWGLEFDSVQIKEISEVSGLKMEIDIIENKHNTHDGKYINTKLPGRPKAGEITLTRGLTGDSGFEKWMKSAYHGDMGGARKSGAVIMYDYMNTPIKRYIIKRAYPKSLEIGTLKAGDTSILTEKLTLTHEGIEVA